MVLVLLLGGITFRRINRDKDVLVAEDFSDTFAGYRQQP